MRVSRLSSPLLLLPSPRLTLPPPSRRASTTRIARWQSWFRGSLHERHVVRDLSRVGERERGGQREGRRGEREGPVGGRRARGVTGLGGFVKAMHCKELTTTILSPSSSLSSSSPFVLAHSLSLRSRVAAFSLSRSLTSRPFFSLYRLSSSPSHDASSLLCHFLFLAPWLFVPLYHCPPLLSVSLQLSLLSSPFSVPFSTALSLEEGAMGRARYLCIVRERPSRDRSRSSTREISFTPSSSFPSFFPSSRFLQPRF